MISVDERRLQQIVAMADPQRLQLLALVITDPSGRSSATTLAGPSGPVQVVREHLDAMVAVGLLVRMGAGETSAYHPTHDALVRFGASALELSPRADTDVTSSEHSVQLARICERLSLIFADSFSPETVERYVTESYALLSRRATITQHLPVLTARFASERLSALVTSAPHQATAVDVLFVCVRNAGRSQIAAALLRATAGDLVRVRTAGSAPARSLDPTVRRELARRGLAGLTELPRPLTEEVVRGSDVVVTMGCGDACPVLPGRRYLDWPVEDPAGRDPETVRAIIEEIEQRVLTLVAELDLRRPAAGTS